jgi:hypothetical protein
MLKCGSPAGWPGCFFATGFYFTGLAITKHPIILIFYLLMGVGVTGFWMGLGDLTGFWGGSVRDVRGGEELVDGQTRSLIRVEENSRLLTANRYPTLSQSARKDARRVSCAAGRTACPASAGLSTAAASAPPSVEMTVFCGVWRTGNCNRNGNGNGESRSSAFGEG